MLRAPVDFNNSQSKCIKAHFNSFEESTKLTTLKLAERKSNAASCLRPLRNHITLKLD